MLKCDRFLQVDLSRYSTAEVFTSSAGCSVASYDSLCRQSGHLQTVTAAFLLIQAA